MSRGVIEVTLFGFELNIVMRRAVSDPPPPLLRLPRLLPIKLHHYLAMAEDPHGEGPAFVVETYRYEGLGIYRRVA